MYSPAVMTVQQALNLVIGALTIALEKIGSNLQDYPNAVSDWRVRRIIVVTVL